MSFAGPEGTNGEKKLLLLRKAHAPEGEDDASLLIELLIDTLIELYFGAETRISGRKLELPGGKQTRLNVLFCL